MHMDMSQEPFCVEMHREKSHPDAGTDMPWQFPLQFPGDCFAPRFWGMEEKVVLARADAGHAAGVDWSLGDGHQLNGGSHY